MPKGPKGERRPADLNKRAFAIVQIASHEAEDNPTPAGQSKAGKVGGRNRAAKLTAEQKREISKRAAAARWRKSD